MFVTAVICWCFLSVDPWFEITPHEAGYSLTGAFVETSSFGCQFDNGSKTKHQPEMDMLYLQGNCNDEAVRLDPIAALFPTRGQTGKGQRQ